MQSSVASKIQEAILFYFILILFYFFSMVKTEKMFLFVVHHLLCSKEAFYECESPCVFSF